jgi:hypothetical protein
VARGLVGIAVFGAARWAPAWPRPPAELIVARVVQQGTAAVAMTPQLLAKQAFTHTAPFVAILFLATGVLSCVLPATAVTEAEAEM